MQMQIIDWAIVLGMLIFITLMVLYTRRYNRSVADFLAANRSAGRYLLCIADGMAALGAITIVMMFEMYYQAGFPVIWWDMFRMMIIPTVLSLAGWVIYRFRQTRALTLAQFLEMRYSRNLRIFAGILIWFSGIINFGIFPAVGARFFMAFLGIPDSTLIYASMMVVLLGFSLFFTFAGGQIAVMVADFLQGIFCNIMFVIIIVAVFFMFGWDTIIEALKMAPEGESMIHPFRVEQAEDFNIWFYLILAFTATYGFLSWQGTSGYNSSAKNAHEARMGKSLSFLRLLIQLLFVLVLGVCAYTFMNHPAYSEQSVQAKQILSEVPNETIRKQVTPTVALRFILPSGLLGGMFAVMLAAFISTHDTYLHSWGSIFIQDVILPFRKKKLTPRQHIRLLRWSICGVAVFVFFFSLFFRQTEYIIMYFMITGAIWIGGAGAVIIGGLYWSRGTTEGAWGGLITGCTLSTASIVLQQIHQQISEFQNPVLAYIGSQNGAVLSFWASIGAITAYVSISLLGKRRVYNMDRLLHRGKYAVEDDKTEVDNSPIGWFRKVLGMGRDFSFKDKCIYLGVLFWTLGLAGLFVIVTAWNLLGDVTTQWWINFWRVAIWVLLVLGTAVTIWLGIGGIIDMKKMFARLHREDIDETDDGRAFIDEKSASQPESDKSSP